MFRTLFIIAALAIAPTAQAQDMVNLSTAVIHSSPADVASWPVTETITRLTMASPAGLSFVFDHELPETWKYHPNAQNPSDNFQYTVWACVPLGQWHCAGFIEMWQGRPSTGAPILTDYNKNWAYDAVRWAPMNTYVPQPGATMAFFATAGDARNQGGATSVRERSNVVTVTLPVQDSGTFTFNEQPPAPNTVTPPSPTPAPTPDLSAQLEALKAQQASDTAQILAAIADLKKHIDAGIQRIGDTYLPLVFSFIGKGTGK